jgi:CO/xanthine dehydrogenase FAD-binding subunit
LRGAPLDGHLADRVERAHLAPLSPIDDIRGSAAYRSDSVVVLLRRLLAGFAT